MTAFGSRASLCPVKRLCLYDCIAYFSTPFLFCLSGTLFFSVWFGVKGEQKYATLSDIKVKLLETMFAACTVWLVGCSRSLQNCM